MKRILIIWVAALDCGRRRVGISRGANGRRRVTAEDVGRLCPCLWAWDL